MLLYKDIVTGKIRRTFGTPVGIERAGPLGAWCLRVTNRSSVLWIPEYLLFGASRAWFNTFKAQKGGEVG